MTCEAEIDGWILVELDSLKITTDSDFFVNGGIGNVCEVGSPILDETSCQAAAMALGLPYKGDYSLNYPAGGCFEYDPGDGSARGVYLNTHAGSSTGTEYHHKVCVIDYWPTEKGGHVAKPSYCSFSSVGWCLGGPDDHVGEADSLGACWQLCSYYYDDLVSVDYDPDDWECYCQTDCTALTDTDDSDGLQVAILKDFIPDSSGLECVLDVYFDVTLGALTLFDTQLVDSLHIYMAEDDLVATHDGTNASIPDFDFRAKMQVRRGCTA